MKQKGTKLKLLSAALNKLKTGKKYYSNTKVLKINIINFFILFL